MPSTLITGANRGIGLELARQHLADGWTVYATCRDPDKATQLAALPEGGGALRVMRLDVTKPEEVQAVADALAGAPIDILFNNAGIIDSYGVGVAEGKDDPDLRNYDFDLWREILDTNVVAQGRVTGVFVDNLLAGEVKQVVMVTSFLGSIESTWQGGRYAYRTSKAALNMLTRVAGAWLEPMGITVVSLAPGWTRTELGGPNAPNSVADAVAGMRTVLAGLTIEDTGTYWNFDGRQFPW